MEAQKSPGPCFFSLATNPTKIDAGVRSPPTAEWAWSGRVVPELKAVSGRPEHTA